MLLGAILVVSGPTVVLPLLRFARVREPVNGILRWEGIFIDPVGATLAIVVLEVVTRNEGTGFLSGRVLTTTLVGVAAGLIAAFLLVVLLARHLVPDQLHNPFTLAMVVAAFAAADVLRPEAGLFATTVMGVAVANQSRVPIAHIRAFKEDLGQLILAGLFIILGSRVDLDQLVEYLPQSFALSALLILVARPLTVVVSTVGSGLSSVERGYLACMSPRGIVAASVSALFAIELEEAGDPVEALVPVTFLVIIISVAFSAVASQVGAKRFRVARPSPRGIAFIGGPSWAVALAEKLQDLDVPSIVVTTDPVESTDAASRGVLTFVGMLESEDFDVALDSVGAVNVIAVSRFDEFNSFGVERATETIGRAGMFHLSTDRGEMDHATKNSTVVGRDPFGGLADTNTLESMFDDGASFVHVTAGNWDEAALADAIPMVDIDRTGTPTLDPAHPERPPAPGATRIYLVPAGAADAIDDAIDDSTPPHLDSAAGAGVDVSERDDVPHGAHGISGSPFS